MNQPKISRRDACRNMSLLFTGIAYGGFFPEDTSASDSVTSGVDWERFDKEPYLRKKSTPSVDMDLFSGEGYVFEQFEDTGGMGRGFRRVRKPLSDRIGYVEFIDFERNGWVLDFEQTETGRVLVHRGTSNLIDAVHFPFRPLKGERKSFWEFICDTQDYISPTIQRNLFIPQEGENGGDIYKKATREYTKMVKDLFRRNPIRPSDLD